MNTAELKKFAQTARRELREQVAARLEQVLRTDSAALREKSAAVRELQEQIACTSKKAVIDRVAYTWFNRFCALRFMDVNHYTRMGVVSPTEGFTQPEILQEAKQGYIAEEIQHLVDTRTVLELLNGQRPSADPQGEAYRLLLVGMCNFYNTAMPFLFEKIADYTELLMPQDLLSDHSILHDLREALTPDACQDVEVIGWLYQFYISERKDEVFDALKANQKIEAEDIPAATQLFTPHWIVRYLVENSLGRLWMLNHPTSRLVEQMDYYIKPEEPETDFLRVTSPEEIKVCDPACGSGHMLTYAFDLLYAIYEETGYPSSDIPRLILEKNLYGIEIDERAGALAAFAMAMKARGIYRRFFNQDVQPNICVMENVNFTDQELKEYAAAMGRDLFTEPLLQTLKQFEQAKNIGSLIRPVLTNPAFVIDELERKGLGGSIFLYQVHKRVIDALRMATFLNCAYNVAVMNPPYMGNKGMNDSLKEFAQSFYPFSKSDLFAMFVDRGLELIKSNGYLGMVTMESWMFLSTYDQLRTNLLNKSTVLSMVHMPYLGKGGTSMGINFGTAATIFRASVNKNYKADYSCVRYYETDDNGVPFHFPVENERLSKASTEDLLKIPGSPVAYWVSDKIRKVFGEGKKFSLYAEPRLGMATGNNDIYVRLWTEVSQDKLGLGFQSRDDAKNSLKKWFPYNKGGNFRRWYGNNDYVVNWENDGFLLQNTLHPGGGRTWAHNFNLDYIFKPSITWTFVSSAIFGARLSPEGFLFDVGGSSAFPTKEYLKVLGAFLGSKLAFYLLRILNPTLNFQAGNIADLPLLGIESLLFRKKVEAIFDKLQEYSKKDWDSQETSWEFKSPTLLNKNNREKVISIAYESIQKEWKDAILDMRSLEEENNQFFINAYGLENEITPDTPIEEISLTYNPHYRYGGKHSESELESLLLADSMREFISYAVGCMFGRYSLDKPGLILANQGETLADYLRQVPDPTFLPDEDNVIPVLEGEWFSDDITERFKKFLRVTFGAQHYEENLAFIEQAIGRDIRSYFLKEFYAQHVKMYQKRPIYWMFSSPKGSFNVLVYMHRYKPDTISVILNKYLREFRGKLEARKAYLEGISISASAPAREKTSALKELEKLNKIMAELLDYERDTLYPLALQKIAIDLDDGVKVNYNKFGKALAKITGLSE